MKRNSVMNYGFCLLLLLCTGLGHAMPNQELEAGPSTGGGGADTELQVNEIRENILQWVQAGRAAELKFPSGLDAEKYKAKILPLLAPKFVVISFVTAEQEAEARQAGHDELQVIVHGQPKECRGFISKVDRLPHILCSTERFPKKTAAQYRLIHHEYAGLAGVEKNTGAASDYELSEQLTNKLQPELVWRLPITPLSEASMSYYLIRSVRSNETRYIKIIENENHVGYRQCDVYGCVPIGNKEFYLKSDLKRARNLSYAKVGVSALAAASVIYASAAACGYLAGYFLAAKSGLGGLMIYMWGGIATGASAGLGLSVKIQKLNPMTYWNQGQLLRKSLNSQSHEVVDLIEFSDTLSDLLNGIRG